MIYNLAGYLFCRPDRKPGHGGGRGLWCRPGSTCLLPLGNLFGLGRQQSDLPDAGGKKHGNIKHVAAFSVVGRRGGHSGVFTGDIPGQRAAAAVPGRQSGYIRLCGKLSVLGRGDGRDPHYGQSDAGTSAQKRGPCQRGQRGHDVRRNPQCGTGSGPDLRLPYGCGGRRHRDGIFQRRFGRVLCDPVSEAGKSNFCFSSSETFHLSFCRAHILCGTGLCPGNGPRQCLPIW